MANRELRLVVGASLDASFTTVFASVIATVKRARTAVQREMKEGATAGATETKKGASTQDKAYADLAKQAAKWQKEQTRDAAREGKERVSMHKAWLKEMAADERAYNAKIKSEAKANKSPGGGGSGSNGQYRGGTGSFSNAALTLRAGRAAFGLANRAAAGMGFDFDPMSHMQAGIDNQALATTISNNAWISSGVGPTGSGQRVDQKEILEQSQATGNATGYATGDVLEGTRKFVALTGDLQTARDVMKDIGVIAKANGAEFEDMMASTAAISNAMGDIPNKGEQLSAVMKTIAGQGQLSAIEIKDMAKNMGYLTARANYFKIDPLSAKTLSEVGVTNETGQRVAVTGALAQYARQKGGRISAKLATRSAMVFMQDLANPNEVKRLHGMGIDPYADAGHTRVKDPLLVMLEIFKKSMTKGGINMDVINKAIPNQQARAVVSAIGQDYNAAYNEAAKKTTNELERHEKAAHAVTAQFQNMLKVTQSNAELQVKFKNAMSETKTQALLFKNTMEKVTGELASALLPAIQTLAPAIISAVSAIAGAVTDATGSTEGINNNASDAAWKRGGTAEAHLRASVKAGDVSDEAVKEGAQSIADIEKALNAKKKEVAKEKEARNIWSTDPSSLPTRFKNIFETKENLDKKVQRDMGAIQALERQLTSLKEAQSAAVESGMRKAMMSTTLKVQIENLPVPGASPKTNGKTPADSPLPNPGDAF